MQLISGQSKQVRSLLEDTILRGERITWKKDDATSLMNNHQLVPLNHYLTPERACSDITVVIPTHRRVPVGLKAYAMQACKVLIINNGKHKYHSMYAEDLSIPWKGHGLTRQSVLSYIKTKYVFFSVDDAIPMAFALRNLITTLENKQYDAVIARQIPWPTASIITQQNLWNWTPWRAKHYRVVQTDHVGTLYRTDTLRNKPIPTVPIAEDAWWSIGKNIGCEPSSVVLHSHKRKSLNLFTREYKTHKELYRMGRIKETPSIKKSITGALTTILQYGLREGLRESSCYSARYLASRRVHKQPSP
jgi:hypothetical protein